MSADKEQSTPSPELKLPSRSAVARLRQLVSANPGPIEFQSPELKPREFTFKTVPKSDLAKQIRSELEKSGLPIYNTATYQKDGIYFVDVFIDGQIVFQRHVTDEVKDRLKEHLRSAELGDVTCVVPLGVEISV